MKAYLVTVEGERKEVPDPKDSLDKMYELIGNGCDIVGAGHLR